MELQTSLADYQALVLQLSQENTSLRLENQVLRRELLNATQAQAQAQHEPPQAEDQEEQEAY